MEGEELLKTGKLHLVSNATYICSVFCLIDKFQLYRKPKIKTVILHILDSYNLISKLLAVFHFRVTIESIIGRFYVFQRSNRLQL